MKPVRLFSILSAALALLLAGCLPESKNPLSTPATSRIDSRIEGVFEQQNEVASDDRGYWHFHYRGAKPGDDRRSRVTPWIEILGVSHDKDSGLDTARYRALATRLGPYDYLSFVELDSNDSKKGNYSFARYEITWRGDLRIYLIDNEALVAAVTERKLRGTVKHFRTGKDVLVTDTPERLAAFVTASDPKRLFSTKPLVFRRVAR